jgi:hypothetical protein
MSERKPATDEQFLRVWREEIAIGFASGKLTREGKKASLHSVRSAGDERRYLNEEYGKE